MLAAMQPTLATRLLMAAAGLLGALGVVTAAMAAHGTAAMAAYGDGNELLRTASLFLMIHGVAIAAAAALRQPWSGGLMVLGSLLFCGDLMARAWLGHRILPFAAPAGGSILILGWLALALGSLGRWK